jgi:23S rRNA (guanosine2251-2'-O)-methyltransferase
MRKLRTDELGRLHAGESKHAPKMPVVAVLDNIRSKHNIGAVFRSADAFGVAKIYLCGITACPPDREIQRTALDATESVAWEHCESTQEALTRLKDEGWRITGVEQTDESTDLADFIPAEGEKYALVFGNEVNGIDDGLIHLLDHCVEIPQYGAKHSINVSVSAGIVFWQLNRLCFSKQGANKTY